MSMEHRPFNILFEDFPFHNQVTGSPTHIAGDGLIRQEKWPEAFEVVGLGQPPDEILEDREEDGSPWAA